MTEFDFALILRHIAAPEGSVMSDGTSYFFSEEQTLNVIKAMGCDGELSRLLVLTNNGCTVVGGVGFYGDYDFQEYIFPEYRRQGYMSAVCKNGILKSVLYPKQRVTLVSSALCCVDDVDSKLHLLDLLGLVPANLDEVKEKREKLFRRGILHVIDAMYMPELFKPTLLDCKTLFKTCPGKITSYGDLSLDDVTCCYVLDADKRRIGTLTIKLDTKGKSCLDVDSVVLLDFFEDDFEYALSQWHVICSAVYTIAVELNRLFGIRYFQKAGLSDFDMFGVLATIEEYECDRFCKIAYRSNVVQVEKVLFGDNWEDIVSKDDTGTPFCLVL